MNYLIIGLFFPGLIFGIYYKEIIRKHFIKLLIKIIGYYYVNKNKFIKLYFKKQPIKILNINESLLDHTFINNYKSLNNINYSINHIYIIDYNYDGKIFTIVFDRDNILDKSLLNSNLLLHKSLDFTQGDDDIILVELSSVEEIFKKNYNPGDENQSQKIISIVKKFSGPKGNFYSDILNYKFNSKYLKDEINELLFTKYISISIMYSHGQMINY